jgi:hypothetical protein
MWQQQRVPYDLNCNNKDFGRRTGNLSAYSPVVWCEKFSDLAKAFVARNEPGIL